MRTHIERKHSASCAWQRKLPYGLPRLVSRPSIRQRPCPRRPLLSRALDTVERQPAATSSSKDRSHNTDVVVIGSGIGGLCCAALLTKYGYRVTVCESHYHLGGAAHSFHVDGYTFDAGPSFHAGLSIPKSTNPLRQVLDVIGESVECKSYKRWMVYTPEGVYPCDIGAEAYRSNILSQGGPEALKQWMKLEDIMAPLQTGAGLFPAAGMRGDLGVLITALGFGLRAGTKFALTGLVVPQLTAPFGNVIDKVVTNKWLRKFLDLECFVLSGMLAKDTICAEMAFMFYERNKPGSRLDYPMGGSEAIIAALRRGIEKNGGRIMLNTHVKEVMIEGGRAVGVRLSPKGSKGPQNEVIRAKTVVSNASVWDTQRLLPAGAAPAEWKRKCESTPAIESFVHLHLGIDATGLPPDLDIHHLIVNDWEDITAPQNVVIVSIPTVFDPSLAPPGKAVVHAYAAANEPYDLWEGLDPKSDKYKQYKFERSQCLWKALERIIPDIRERTELELVGTPLTHERFLRRHKGTYGPAISAATGSFPGPGTPIPGLYGCGDSYVPGIGVPAAAASGMITANTLVSVPQQLSMLREMNL